MNAALAEAMAAGYAQGVEATEAKAVKRITELEQQLDAAKLRLSTYETDAVRAVNRYVGAERLLVRAADALEDLVADSEQMNVSPTAVAIRGYLRGVGHA